MLNINKFISENITLRTGSMFLRDIEDNRQRLEQEIKDKKVLVIGGGGTIGSSFIRALLPFEPKTLVVVDISENYLTELTRDLRSTMNMYVPKDYRTYPLNYADPIFEKIFLKEGGFDIVANFSAHKHVRSEKDQYSVEALIENNDLKAKRLMELLVRYRPKHFFCVSTDKAANPVNIMGCSKKVMEEMIMSYKEDFPITTARFANVAFSNGSLLAGFIDRLMKHQPMSSPMDVKRYFVSPDESGQICLLACVLGKSGEIFFPKLKEKQMMTFSSICDKFLQTLGYKIKYCQSENEAKEYAATMAQDTDTYPVYYFASDTTGEKSFEEFYVEGETINFDRFSSLGVIENYPARDKAEIDKFYKELETLFQKEDFAKSEVVELLKTFIPNFTHEEKGKNLDEKM